jgi:Arc/MetJ-type ribon-helix-helix transcriptional regulator
MKISLNPDIVRYIDAKVRSGFYPSSEAAVNALLAQVREAESLSPEDVEELRVEVGVGLAELDRGELSEFTAEDIKAEGRALLAERCRKGA